MMKAWGELTRGETIVCPRNGKLEKVHFVRKVARGAHVRTNRHDHVVSDRTVEVEVR